MHGWSALTQVGGYTLVSLGCTLTYGAATSAAGRPVDVAAEARVQRTWMGNNEAPLQGLLERLLPPGAALTQLTLQQFARMTRQALAAPALADVVRR